MEIEVTGKNVFNGSGDQLKMRAPVDQSVIESKQLSEMLDFTVSK